jgi:hypothetical protein
VDGYSYSSNVPSPDGYYENHHYEDHYTFTGTLNGSSATIINHIYGSKHNDATGEQPVDDSYSDTQTYSGTLTTRPGFGSGTGTNGNSYPFTGVASGGRFSDSYWQPLASTGSGYNSQSRVSSGAFTSANAKSQSNGTVEMQTATNSTRWQAGDWRQIIDDPMGNKSNHVVHHYGGAFPGCTPEQIRDRGWGWPSWSDYFHYLRHPSHMDQGLQDAQKTALKVSAVAGGTALGLGVGGAIGRSLAAAREAEVLGAAAEGTEAAAAEAVGSEAACQAAYAETAGAVAGTKGAAVAATEAIAEGSARQLVIEQLENRVLQGEPWWWLGLP